MNKEAERYLDFSEEDENLEAFRPGIGADETLNHWGKQIQQALRLKNPVIAIHRLLAEQILAVQVQTTVLRSYLQAAVILLAAHLTALIYIAYRLS